MVESLLERARWFHIHGFRDLDFKNSPEKIWSFIKKVEKLILREARAFMESK